MICVVGTGNPLRSDDGVGPYVAAKIDALQLPDVETFITQQLHLEFIDKFFKYDRVILVDACLAGKDFDFYSMAQAHNRTTVSSHHLDAKLFSELAQRLYGKNINLYICSVKGRNFDVGDVISADVLACAQKAIELICSCIGSHSCTKAILPNK